jgi:hypothetical protein
MAIEIVDLPSNSMVMFHSFLYVYQRGDHHLAGDTWKQLGSLKQKKHMERTENTLEM